MPVSLFEFKASGIVFDSSVRGTGIEVGDAASISFVFDANASGSGNLIDQIVGKVVSVFGDETFRSSAFIVSLTDNDIFFGDEFSLSTDPVAPDSGGFPAAQTQLLFSDFESVAISSIQALPTSLLLSDFQDQFDTAQLSLTGIGTATANVTSLSLTPVATVPLPATMPMLLLGLGFVGVVLRRRKA